MSVYRIRVSQLREGHVDVKASSKKAAMHKFHESEDVDEFVVWYDVERGEVYDIEPQYPPTELDPEGNV